MPMKKIHIEDFLGATIEVQNESVMPSSFITNENNIDQNFKDIDVADANKKFSGLTRSILDEIDNDIAARELTP